MFRLFFILVIVSCAPGYQSKNAEVDTASGGVAPMVATPGELEAKAVAIFQARCTGCHSATVVNGGLGPVVDKGHLLAQGFVVPGGAVNSLLWDAVNSNRMPLSGPLGDADKSVIRAWIIDGVPNLAIPQLSFNPLKAIIQAKCLSCHALAAGNAGGVNLETYANVRARVIPAQPDTSPLFMAVLSERMPKVGTKLTLKELAVVYDWILAGAFETGRE